MISVTKLLDLQYYSSVQAWFTSEIYKKSDLTTPGICQVTSFLSFIPAAKPAETAASTVCGLIDNGIKIINMVNKNVDLNADWQKARLSSPGTGLVLQKVCNNIASDIGSICIVSAHPA